MLISTVLSLLVTIGPAHAAVVNAVPPGVSSVTVMACEQPQGCVPELRAMAAHLDSLGLPLLDFGAVVDAGPGGGLARRRYDKAMSAAARSPTLANLQAARDAMRELPVTLPADDVFTLLLQLGAAELYSGDSTAADSAFEAAVSSSDGRVVNLPAMTDAALSRYLYLASAPARVRDMTLSSDVAGQVYVDGKRMGDTPGGGVPTTLSVRAGWHRVSVERPGRRSAWVVEVDDAAGAVGVPLRAEIAGDDGAGFLGTAIEGALRGVAPPADAGEQLATWARSQGLRWVRFVTLAAPGEGDGRGLPEESFEDAEHNTWYVYATWLDVGTGRFGKGPGPASLRIGGSPDRLRLGVGVGYTRMQPVTPEYGAHDHVDVDLTVRWRLVGAWSIDGRVGLMRSAQLYYLREGVFEHDVYPVAVGMRYGDRGHGASGPYIGAHALVIVPLTEGGELFFGYEVAPTWRWRVGIEVRAGMTVDGVVGGAGLTFATGG